MGSLFSFIGLIALYAFGLFVTVGFWVMGVAAFMQWAGLL